MAIQWTQDLSVYVEEIDNQHKELFRRINNLRDAMKQGKGRMQIGSLLKFLEDLCSKSLQRRGKVYDPQLF